MIRSISIATAGQGLYEITREVQQALSTMIEEAESGDDHFKDGQFKDGLCTVFLQHTSASLIIQENADPSARSDLERWLKRLVPEKDPLFTHTAEGPDDMPSHIKAALTATSLGIPVMGAELALGTWQGIYLWEHRSMPQRRKVVISLIGY